MIFFLWKVVLDSFRNATSNTGDNSVIFILDSLWHLCYQKNKHLRSHFIDHLLCDIRIIINTWYVSFHLGHDGALALIHTTVNPSRTKTHEIRNPEMRSISSYSLIGTISWKLKIVRGTRPHFFPSPATIMIWSHPYKTPHLQGPNSSRGQASNM